MREGGEGKERRGLGDEKGSIGHTHTHRRGVAKRERSYRLATRLSFCVFVCVFWCALA